MGNILGISDEAYAKIQEGIRGAQADRDDKGLLNTSPPNTQKPIIPTIPGGSGGGGWMGVAGAINMANSTLPGAMAGAQAGIASTGIPGPTAPDLPQEQQTTNPIIATNQNNSSINAQDYINQLNDLRKNAALGALQKSHDAALSNMGVEKSAIQPKYYDQRNQVAAGAQQQARNFAEYMANRGGTSSGANAQATLSNNMNTQSNLGTLGRQEAQAFTDIERRTSDLNNAYQSDIATTTANAEADKMSALLEDYYKAQQRGDTLAQNQIQNAMAQSQLAMQQQGQQFDQNLATTQQKQNEANTKFAQEMQIDAVTYQKARDAIADKNYQKEFEVNIKQQGFENALKTALQAHQISNDNYQLAISQQNANTSSASQGTSASNAQINQLMDVWKATGKAPAGIPNVVAGTPYGGQEVPKPVEISSKDSTDAYTTIIEELTDAKDLAEAYMLIEANKGFLTDADYRAAKAEAKKKFEKPY